MLERKIATYDKTNFRKRLNEFLEVAKIYKQDDLNEHNIYIKQNNLEMQYINV